MIPIGWLELHGTRNSRRPFESLRACIELARDFKLLLPPQYFVAALTSYCIFPPSSAIHVFARADIFAILVRPDKKRPDFSVRPPVHLLLDTHANGRWPIR